MSKKLLHKTSKAYLIFALLLLLVAAPLFYILIEKLYIDDADEALLLHKNEFIQYSVKNLKTTDVPIWNKFNRDIKIIKATSLKKDSLFYTFYYDTLYNENEPYRELRLPIKIEGKSYTYSARINLVETSDLIESIAILFLVIISLLLIGLFFISKRLSLNLWKPFYKTLLQIEQFEIDKSNLPQFAETDTEEFNRLNQSIQKLIEKNTSIYRGQREFIENAAHELQTPLAVFQAKIDTLIQRNDVTQEQSEILSSLNDNVSKLNRLNKNLLLLSKIENDHYANKQTFYLKEAIEKNLGFFIEQAAAKNISIKTDIDPSFSIVSNPVLAEVLISNLFLNALKHNISNGQITITFSNQLLSFSNTGLPTTLTTDKLFNRFSKSNTSEHGNGLGLAIVKKIVDSNDWTIRYNFNHNFHCFTIDFRKF
ncbi:sensor histidine kinase [Flavobacterium sp. 7A]|uniref:sensor histidine kinase n=1 Tax=Flavobacterium sp. 7A TaxID=2940571 RepID=UPI0022261FC9|nr:HAMP domain-containing sensor histidine kinase [Flavobacterium sp. 7A]MCW2118253.1 signal transduction histidine kinase [Flavobacterium sp. 7A]